MMKTIIKIITAGFSLFMILFYSTSAFAVSLYVDGEYTYADVDSYHVALYDYSGEDSLLTIPEEFAGRYVSEIYSYSFERNVNITGIDFSQNGNRLTIIDTKAFNECTELRGELNLPSSVRTLGFAAFQGCVNLDKLIINYGLNEIPAQCFNRCSNLKEITLAPSVETIDNLAFARCTSLESVFIPTSVTYISTSAFNGCYPTLYVYYESYAHQYAIDNRVNYVVINPPKPTEPPTEPETEEPTVPETQEPTVMETDTPTEEPTVPETVEPTQPVTKPKGYYLGDADGNGSVDNTDVTWIQRYVANMNVPISKETLSHSDVDNDGVVNIVDATFIQRYLAQLNTPFGIGDLINEYT